MLDGLFQSSIPAVIHVVQVDGGWGKHDRLAITSSGTTHVEEHNSHFSLLCFHIQCQLTGEEVVIILPQFDGSLIELPGTFPGLWTQSGPHGLHALLVVGVEEDDNRVPLSVVQPVHSIGGDVQHSMFVLYETKHV